MSLQHIENTNEKISHKSHIRFSEGRKARAFAHSRLCAAHHTGSRFAAKSLSVLFAVFAFAVTSVAFVSCSDLFSPVNPIERPDNPNPSTNPALSEHARLLYQVP